MKWPEFTLSEGQPLVLNVLDGFPHFDYAFVSYVVLPRVWMAARTIEMMMALIESERERRGVR